MDEVANICEAYLAEKLDDREFMRLFMEAVRSGGWQVEVAEAILSKYGRKE